MSGDRSTRNALAAIFLVIALFVAMNLVVSGAPLLDWWLPLILSVIGLVFVYLPTFGLRSSPETAADADSGFPQLPANVHDYEVSSYNAVTVEALLPFPESAISTLTPKETPVSPETPAPLIEPQPEVDVPPMSPETPTPAADAEPENVPASPETPAPPPDDSVTATEREPETEVVAEKTAAPQQPYEAEQVGEITPERAERVMDGNDADAPLVTEAASDNLTRIDGIGEKSAAALRAAGIDSYEKLANSSIDAVREAISAAGVRLVGDVDTWGQQAAYAARGDWEGLETFNRERKAPKA